MPSSRIAVMMSSASVVRLLYYNWTFDPERLLLAQTNV